MQVARRQDAAEISQWWALAPQLDEPALRNGVLQLLKHIHEAAVEEDWSMFREQVLLYKLGEPYCKEEPQLSVYEYGLMAIEIYFSNNHINRGEFDKAAEYLSRVNEMYVARMQRYAELGVPPRRASEVRFRYLHALAEIKWLAGEAWRNFLLSPEDLLTQMQETFDHIVGFITANPGAHDNQSNLMEVLALGELQGLKMAVRYMPAHVEKLVRTFNEHYSDQLALPVGHYKQVNASMGDKSAYYWDFELAKLRFDTGAPAQDVYMCIELRSVTARNTFGSWRIQGLLRFWRHEALVMVRELKARQGAPTS